MIFGSIAELGIALTDLADQHAAWSQETFGSDKERGPEGPLKHMRKEIEEVLANPTDLQEYADLLLLLLDASRRAGIGPYSLIRAGQAKLKINKERTWPKPTGMSDAVEHVKS